jgi:hypothetical protein
MTDEMMTDERGHTSTGPSNFGLLVAAFTATTFLSAILLFSIQPLFAKMVLPVLGGAPSVWAVAVCFFQIALLIGYCYAHVLKTSVQAGHAGYLHLAFCLMAFAALPITLPGNWGQPPPGEPYLWQRCRAAVRGGGGECTAAAGVVRRDAPPGGARSLFSLCGEQSR